MITQGRQGPHEVSETKKRGPGRPRKHPLPDKVRKLLTSLLPSLPRLFPQLCSLQKVPVKPFVGPIVKSVIGHPDANHNAKDFIVVVNALCDLMGEERRQRIQVWMGGGSVCRALSDYLLSCLNFAPGFRRPQR